MDEPWVFINRLQELLELSVTEDPYQKASIFAANEAILNKFKISKLGKDTALLNSVKDANFYINTVIGYAFIKNKSEIECRELAQKKLEQASDIINIRY